MSNYPTALHLETEKKTMLNLFVKKYIILPQYLIEKTEEDCELGIFQ